MQLTPNTNMVMMDRTLSGITSKRKTGTDRKNLH
jgi:hypothetical protein